MIEKIHSVFYVVCDYCGEEHAETFYYFKDAVSVIRSDGWMVIKMDRYWEIICSDCMEME